MAWGNVVEDFLDPLGVSLESFSTDFRGSWIFGYAEALKQVGMRPFLIFVSRGISVPSRVKHLPTGTDMWLLPSPHIYRALERRMVYPYGQTVTHMFGEIVGMRRMLLPFFAVAKELSTLLATPLAPLLTVLRRESSLALICQEYEYPRFDVCVAAGKVIGIPVFGCFQGGNYRHARLEALTRSVSIRSCAGLIIGPEQEVSRVRTAYNIPRSKITRIFNPIDTEVWRPLDRGQARTAVAIPADADVVVWHGRVATHKKGLDVLLGAWRQLCGNRGHTRLRLLLVGTGDDAAALERHLSGADYGDSVIWINEFLHDPIAIRRYLSAADVYAFPSRYEGFPVAPIEAMACGLPVVATDVEGIREIIGDGGASAGVVVPCNDANALAAELEQLLDDAEQRRAIGARARARAESRFSLRATGEQLRALIQVDS